MSYRKVRVLVARLVWMHLQSKGECNGYKADVSHTFSDTLFFVVVILCCSYRVAKERYQMNAGSYLVTLLISCGPALPCGCGSRGDGNEEEEEEWRRRGRQCGCRWDNSAVARGEEACNHWVNKCGTYGALHCQGHHLLNKYTSHFTWKFSSTKDLFWCLKGLITNTGSTEATTLKSPPPLTSAALAAGVLLLSGILAMSGCVSARWLHFTPHYKTDSHGNFKSNQR